MVGDTTLVPPLATSTSSNNTPSGQRPQTRDLLTIHDILASTRMEFLSLALTRLNMARPTVRDLMRAHRTSTCRQYESGWKKFQSFVAANNVKEINPGTLAEFATFVFHSGSKVSPATVTNAMVAVRDPISYGFGVIIEDRTWDLLRASIFQQRPPAPPVPPSWALSKVLDLLLTPRFQRSTNPADLLLRALFLVSMATGHRVSQLAALLRTIEFLKFGPNDSSVTLAAHPRFLAKNEWEGHRMTPVVVNSWREEGRSHPLCPVGALRTYVAATEALPRPELWLDPSSGKPLSTSSIAKKLVQLKSLADPQAKPKAHHIRKFASSRALVRSFDVEKVRIAGQWSSANSFVERYLLTHLEETRCIAMFFTPHRCQAHRWDVCLFATSVRVSLQAFP